LRTLNSYLVKSLLSYLLMAIAIGTFVMMIGSFARVFDLLFKDVSIEPLLMFVVYKTPQLLAYTIPMSLLIAVLLLFNRLSADNEITGLRASGISLLQIITPSILLSLILSAICLLLQVKVGPDFSFAARWYLREQGAKNPLVMLEEGVFNEMFDGYIIYIDRKVGNEIFDVHIYALDVKTGQLRQDITAERGTLAADTVAKTLDMKLYNATIITIDPEYPDDVTKVSRVLADSVEYPFEYARALTMKHLVRKLSDMNVQQLFAHIQLCGENGTPPTAYIVELHMRAAMALAPFSLVLIAIPLGLRISRRETSAGLVGGMAVAVAYFGTMLLVDTVAERPRLMPHLLVWVPNIVCQGAGLWGLWRKR
jgi:lipopolysaccharide export system permease protein